MPAKQKKLTKIKVERTIQEVVTRKVKRKVEIPLEDIRSEDIDGIDDMELLKAISRAMIRLYEQYRQVAFEQNEVLVSISKGIEPQPPSETSITVEESVPDTEAPVEDKKPNKRHTEAAIQLGLKRGKTSKYHYVYWNTSQSKWIVTLDKSRFDNEMEAALHADIFLDGNQDEHRPRNRDKHPEIRELYEQQLEVVQDET